MWHIAKKNATAVGIGKRPLPPRELAQTRTVQARARPRAAREKEGVLVFSINATYHIFPFPAREENAEALMYKTREYETAREQKLCTYDTT